MYIFIFLLGAESFVRYLYNNYLVSRNRIRQQTATELEAGTLWSLSKGPLKYHPTQLIDDLEQRKYQSSMEI